jgi:DNA-binding NarL/FixJ family response regulator
MAAAHDSRALRAELLRLVQRLGALAEPSGPEDLPPSDAEALRMLRQHGPLPQSALQVLLGIDKSNVSRLRARLVAAGRVEAIASRSEGRPISVLKMTPAGWTLAERLEKASDKRFAALLRQIPAHRRKRVFAALGHLNDALARLAPDLEKIVAALQKAALSVDDQRQLLGARELQVFRLLAEGMTSTHIAERLSISRRTVDSHRATILRKLELGSQSALIRFAIEKGLLPMQPRQRARTGSSKRQRWKRMAALR